MNRNRTNIIQTLTAAITLLALCVMPVPLVAQTKIAYHSNKFSAQDDVKVGRQAGEGLTAWFVSFGQAF